MFSVALMLLLAAGSCVYSIDLIQPDAMVVQPGQSLTITCQVSGYSLTDNSYATGWIRQREGKPMDWIFHQWGGNGGNFWQNNALKNKFSYSRDMSAGSVTLTGQNLEPEDTAVYYCVRRRSSSYEYWGKGTMVTVTSATSTGPTVFPLTTCSSDSGSKVTLGCLATGFTPSSLTFAWNKNGTAVSNFIQYPAVQKGSHYMRVSQIDVTRQDWDAMYGFQCAVTHPAGNAQTRYIIKPPPIPEPPCQQPTLKVLASSDEDNEISFSCFAKDFSPKDYEIKWLKNDVEITSEIYNIKTKPEEIDYKNGTILYNAGSFLTMRSSDVPVKTKLTCQFKGRGANCDAFKNATIIYSRECTGTRECLEADVEINIEGPSLESMFLNKEAIIKCQVKVNRPGVEKIFWEDESGKEMADAVLIPSNGRGTFTLPLEITYDEWSPGVKRYCVVEHRDWYEPMKKVYERNIGGQIERPSVFMLPPVEHAKKHTVTLTCYVKDFFPQDVFVSWLVDDEPANSEYEFSTTNPVKSQRDELYSAYGQLSLSLDQWKQNDIVYSCVVYHQSVANSTKAIVRSIGHRTFEKTNLVNLNMNVPETCKAQ